MTVAELIEKLKSLDSNLPIGKFIKGDSNGPDSLFQVKEVNVVSRRVYNHKENSYEYVTFVELKTGL